MKGKGKENSISNYLDRIPIQNNAYVYDYMNDTITVLMENRGIMNRICQMLLGKPKVSYIHFDAFGSFLWSLMDGKRSIYELGHCISAEFGDKVEPLYERLANYIARLERYSFIILQNAP